jgi:two-component system chemotaxis response regulator CheB
MIDAPDVFVCPTCGGSLYEHGVPASSYHCYNGRAFTGETLLADQAEVASNALWVALRSLSEQAELCRRLAGQARRKGRMRQAHQYTRMAKDALLRARQVRALVEPVAGADDGGHHRA